MLTGHPNKYSRTGAHAVKLPSLLVLALLIFLWPQHLLAQAPIDSSRFDWFVPLHTTTPPGYFCEPLELGDGNMLAWWATNDPLPPPYYDEAYGAVVSPEGEILISDQLTHQHIGKEISACSGFNSCFYQMEIDYEGDVGPFIDAVSVYRILADYPNDDLLPVAEQVLFTLEDSLTLGTYRSMAASESRFLVVHGLSDSHVDSARYLGNRLVMMDALTLDVYLDTLLVDDTSRYLVEATESGFHLRGRNRSLFVDTGGAFSWEIDNELQLQSHQLSSNGANLVFSGRNSGDSVFVAIQDQATGLEEHAQLLLTNVESSVSASAKWSGENVICVFAGDISSSQPGQISVFDSHLQQELAFAELDTVLTGAKFVGPDLIRFSTSQPLLLRYRMEAGELLLSDFHLGPYDYSATIVPPKFVYTGGAMLGLYLGSVNGNHYPVAFRLSDWEPVTAILPQTRPSGSYVAVDAWVEASDTSGRLTLHLANPSVQVTSATLYNLLGQRCAQWHLGAKSAGASSIPLVLPAISGGRYYLKIDSRSALPFILPVTLLP
ncbi:MAG: hypothetical protein KDC10_10430 [Calditrichaeota bacterium]|nr:hypothetical protein [Candidatus Cloacimonadota bacterium]MCB1047605.1 hypothetical protein [Calditrichota bacterium]